MGKRKESDVIDIDSEDEGATENEPQYYVEVITKARVIGGGKFEYYVKWANYPSTDNTWEPYENVRNCKRLLKSFWVEVGKDNKRNPGPEGMEYAASDKWIEDETLKFEHDMTKGQDAARDDRDEAHLSKTSDKNDKGKSEARKEKVTAESKKEKEVVDMSKGKASSLNSRMKQIVQRQDSLGVADQLFPERSRSATAPRDNPETRSDRDRMSIQSISDDEEPLQKKTKLTKAKNRDFSGPSRATKTSATAGPSNVTRTHEKAHAENVLASTKNKYASLSFKKKAPEGPAPRKDEIVRTGPNRVTFAENPPPLTADDIDLHRSKKVARPDEDGVNLQDSEVYKELFLGNSQQSQSNTRLEESVMDVDMDGADNFLETVASRSAAAAQKPSELAKAEASKKDSTSISRPIVKYEATSPFEDNVSRKPRNAPKNSKWVWEGELFVKANGPFADRLCNIRFEEATDVSEEGFRFNVLMKGKDSVRFDEFYSIFKMRVILRSLKRVDQFSSMCHAGPADREKILVFKRYMLVRKLAARAAVETEFGHVAEMIVFPVESELSGILNVPLSLSSNAMFIVALMPWTVKPSSFKPLSNPAFGLQREEYFQEYNKRASALQPIPLTTKMFSALQLIDFPDALSKMIRGKPYCVWAKSVENMPTDHGRKFGGELLPETAALFEVLSSLGASNVGYKKDLNFVFVHVGAMKTLNSLEALVERRCRRPEIRFFTYGQHSNIKSHLWGVQEIFPTGGVVTFTPASLLEDPIGVANLILRIDEHPLWDSYLLPSALAVFIKMVCRPQSPVEAYVSDPFIFGRLLQYIEEGKVSLLRSPSLEEQPKLASGPSPADDWITTELCSCTTESVELVEQCWRLYISEFANKTETEIYTSLESDIVADLIRMQMQPCIRTDYRRFVVIKAESEKHIAWDKQGFEWHTLDSFKFRDDFHKN